MTTIFDAIEQHLVAASNALDEAIEGADSVSVVARKTTDLSQRIDLALSAVQRLQREVERELESR